VRVHSPFPVIRAPYPGPLTFILPIMLKTKDTHAKTAAHVLSAEYRRERLIEMFGAEIRALQQRWGFAALTDRKLLRRVNAFREHEKELA
jgi:hypothetical protein